MLEARVIIPHSLVEHLETPSVWGPFPEPWETANTYLPRVASQWGVRPGVADLLQALGGQFIARTSFDTNHDSWRFSVWVDQVVRGYGDLELLGFLLAHPSRADMEQHFERVPEQARSFARAMPALCFTAGEGRALLQAVAAAKADGYRKLQAHLRGPVSEQHAAFLSVTPEEGVLDLFLTNAPDSIYFAPECEEQRGKPARIEGPPFLGLRRFGWQVAGVLVFSDERRVRALAPPAEVTVGRVLHHDRRVGGLEAEARHLAAAAHADVALSLLVERAAGHGLRVRREPRRRRALLHRLAVERHLRGCRSAREQQPDEQTHTSMKPKRGP
ncbi:hypothetical protein JY651_14080 [Pyxidicoccus parkwayensis]|uniref:Uncharacterized protein n=1 Tax=Pyxidicoccus parkwayensis TaxID=2813578 RepID=A0ABX7P6C4_9BACT|nr:hypothetical protein [Pyxidicoccus parkwaysis]QSQ25980.1 hypothetical protein JY651_14080 [Pyxidicoccus parkwaysis]